MRELCSRSPEVGGVRQNVDRIIQRLAPDAFLMIAIDDPARPDPVGRIGDRVDSILGPLCLTALLTVEHKEDVRQYQPRPLFWAKWRELCELPLIVDRSAVCVAGHSGVLRWLSPDFPVGIAGRSLATTSDLLAGIPSIPSTARVMLQGKGLETWQEPFRTILKSLHSAFLVGTSAQCASNMVSLAEMCVTSKEHERWKKRLVRLKLVTGCEYWTKVQEIMHARHGYIHGAKRSADIVAFSALALAVQTLCVMHDLSQQEGTIDKEIAFLDSHIFAGFPTEKLTDELAPAERERITSGLADVPCGPLRRLYWVNHALTDISWNDYYEQFAIFDEGFCRKCRRSVGQEGMMGRNKGFQFYRCPHCKEEVCAKLPFGSDR